MIGTLICRNCDTVFEVSEGDVAKFKEHPVFTCTVCQADLSPLMAGFVEGHSASEETVAEEFTVPDDQEVFDGLPMGESFDQAAAKLRQKVVSTSVEAKAEPALDQTVRTAEAPLARKGAGAPAAAAPAGASVGGANAKAAGASPVAFPPPIATAPTNPSASVAAVAQARPANSPMADTVRVAEPPLGRKGGAASPEATPVVPPRTPDATPVMAEDPVQMALRLAAQAAQQAAQMAATGDRSPAATTPARAAARPEAGETTGVALTWKPPNASPIGTPRPANGDARSTDAGVVPEEPENETTLRGAGPAEPSEVTEATVPSPGPDDTARGAALDGRDERTPLMAGGAFAPDVSDEDAIEEAPRDGAGAAADAEAEADHSARTPLLSERTPVIPEPTPAMSPFPDQPPEEVTIRKRSPPAPLSLVRPLIQKSGTGPSSIGALGIRVVMGRPIVRPGPPNGRAASTASDTQIGTPSPAPAPRFEPARGSSAPSSAGIRAPAPAPVVDSVGARDGAPGARAGGRRAQPPWLMYGGLGVGALALAVVAGMAIASRMSGGADGTPAETPVVAESATPVETDALAATPEASAAPTQAAVADATPLPFGSTHRGAVPGATPIHTPFAANTPHVSTPVPAATSATTVRPTATSLVASAATPRTVPTAAAPRAAPMNPEAEALYREATGLYERKEFEKAATKMLLARLKDPNNEQLNYYRFLYAARANSVDTPRYAKEYLELGKKGRYRLVAAHADMAQTYLDTRAKLGGGSH